MSPKPVNVPRALETLRRETLDPEKTEALLHALHRPAPPRRYARPLAFAMMTTALALALVFSPRKGPGSAWAQTMSATLAAPNSHSVTRSAKGHVTAEEWRSGERQALVWRDEGGKVLFESRSDGKRKMRLWRIWGLESANRHPYATLGKDAALPHGAELPFTDLDALLKQRGLSVVSHEEATGARPERYRLRATTPFKAEYLAEIDPGARRIKTLISLDRNSRQSFDYPETLPASRFSLEPPSVPGMEVYDVEAQNAEIKARQLQGLGRSGPVTLRLVALDGDGRLWAIWTGGLPPTGVSGPIRLVGIPSSKAQGTGIYYSNWRKQRPTTYKGEPTGRTMVVPRAKIGASVGLDIPYPGGVAHFRDVPVMRLGNLMDYELSFGDVPFPRH